jgi:hypothetical protein
LILIPLIKDVQFHSTFVRATFVREAKATYDWPRSIIVNWNLKLSMLRCQPFMEGDRYKKQKKESKEGN